MSHEPLYFRPYSGRHGAAPVITETRLIRDLSAPQRTWDEFEAPTKERPKWWRNQPWWKAKEVRNAHAS